jgi:hypothetical protein
MDVFSFQSMNSPFGDLTTGEKLKNYLGMSDWLFFVGCLAVVASLVFVGYLGFCVVQERQRARRIQKRIEKTTARYHRERAALREAEISSPRWTHCTLDVPNGAEIFYDDASGPQLARGTTLLLASGMLIEEND